MPGFGEAEAGMGGGRLLSAMRRSTSDGTLSERAKEFLSGFRGEAGAAGDGGWGSAAVPGRVSRGLEVITGGGGAPKGSASSITMVAKTRGGGRDADADTSRPRVSAALPGALPGALPVALPGVLAVPTPAGDAGALAVPGQGWGMPPDGVRSAPGTPPRGQAGRAGAEAPGGGAAAGGIIKSRSLRELVAGDGDGEGPGAGLLRWRRDRSRSPPSEAGRGREGAEDGDEERAVAIPGMARKDSRGRLLETLSEAKAKLEERLQQGMPGLSQRRPRAHASSSSPSLAEAEAPAPAAARAGAYGHGVGMAEGAAPSLAEALLRGVAAPEEAREGMVEVMKRFVRQRADDLANGGVVPARRSGMSAELRAASAGVGDASAASPRGQQGREKGNGEGRALAPQALGEAEFRPGPSLARLPLSPRGSQGDFLAGERGSLQLETDGSLVDDGTRVLPNGASEAAGGVPSLLGVGARDRNITIVTTASLPWMTGTAVNPLMRAAYLSKRAGGKVTLMVPFLSQEDQEAIHGHVATFEDEGAQEAYVRKWLAEKVPEACKGAKFDIKFYPARYKKDQGSIYAVGDLTDHVPTAADGSADVAVLEEPEHMTWYHQGRRFTDKFKYVVGVVHTNYLDYVRREDHGAIKEAALGPINEYVSRTNVHRLIRISGATQDVPGSVVCNIHGVQPRFLQVGQDIAERRRAGKPLSAHAPATPLGDGGQEGAEADLSAGAYYIGKAVWGKYRELVDLMGEEGYVDEPAEVPQGGGGWRGRKAATAGGTRRRRVEIDCFGSGQDAGAVQQEAAAKGIPLRMYAGRDHGDPAFRKYKVMVNTSMSEVVCTCAAEALAMGKFVVCADHPSNEFFKQFSNCLIFDPARPEDFREKLQYALKHEPRALSEAERHALSWEAATDRFLNVASTEVREAQRRRDLREHAAHAKHVPQPVADPALKQPQPQPQAAEGALGVGARPSSQPP